MQHFSSKCWSRRFCRSCRPILRLVLARTASFLWLALRSTLIVGIPIIFCLDFSRTASFLWLALRSILTVDNLFVFCFDFSRAASSLWLALQSARRRPLYKSQPNSSLNTIILGITIPFFSQKHHESIISGRWSRNIGKQFVFCLPNF